MPVDEMEKFSLPERKQVLLDTLLRGKRMIGLRTYYKEMEKERRGTLISLFKTGNTVAVDQIVDILYVDIHLQLKHRNHPSYLI